MQSTCIYAKKARSLKHTILVMPQLEHIHIALTMLIKPMTQQNGKKKVTRIIIQCSFASLYLCVRVSSITHSKG